MYFHPCAPNPRSRWRARRAASLLLLVLLACERDPAHLREAPTASPEPGLPTPELAERLLATVRSLSDDALEGRRVGTAGNREARRHLAAELEAAGVEPLLPEYRQRFPLEDGVEGVNLVGRLPGAGAGDRHLLLGAHYDHLGVRDGRVFNGADDNASGVAVVLEIARRVSERPLEHSLVVVLFDAEEPGLHGSRALVAAPPIELADLLLAVNLDMVARGDGRGLWAAGSYHYPELRPVLEAVAARAPIPLRLGHDRPEDRDDDWTLLSDHAPFHLAGIPFVYFGVEDHPDYHQPSDDWERIDPRFFAGSALAIEEALRALDRALADGLRFERERPLR
ncbi:MAG TPA: M28 family peptidase [Thermoanaerobaculia bacterium]|nr:M28 family peptidase [Thermoanaerobaculia bacterium]